MDRPTESQIQLLMKKGVSEEKARSLLKEEAEILLTGIMIRDNQRKSKLKRKKPKSTAVRKSV